MNFLSFQILSLLRNNIIMFYSLLIMLLFWSPVTAQENFQYNQKFDMSDGLSSTQLTFCYHDSRGIIWMGTSYGVNSYDGTKITSYTEEEGLLHNYVLNITEDDLGNIWVTSGDFSSNNYFISIIDPVNGQILSMEEYLISPTPFTSSYVQYIGLCNGSMLLMQKIDHQITFYELKERKTKELFSTNFIGEIVSDKNTRYRVHTLWKNNYGGVSFVVTYPRDENKYHNVKMISMDMEGNITRNETMYGGMFLHSFYHENKVRHCGYNKEMSKFYLYDDDRLINIIAYDGQKRISHRINMEHVISLYHETGELTFLESTGNEIKKKYSLDENLSRSIGDVFFDNLNGLWFSSDESIMRMHFRQKKFITYQKNKENGYGNSIRGITKNETGEVYFASQEGLNFIDRDSIKLIGDHDLKLPIHGALGMCQTDQQIYIGSEFKGLLEYSFETKKIQIYPFKNTSYKLLWQPYVDRYDNVWIGAEGLYKLNKRQKIVEYVNENSQLFALRNSIIYNFTNSETGTWLSTSDGLFLVDLKNEKILAHYNSEKTSKYYLPLKNCVHLHIDMNGIFWIATKGQGLVKWDPNTGTYDSFTKAKSGLSHNVLYAVYEDDYGTLWLPSNFGLMRFDKNSKNITTYLKEDGIPNNEFNTTAHHQDEQGYMYFGTINGMVKFHPRDFSNEKVIDPFLLTNVYHVNKENDQRTTITEEILNSNKVVIRPEQKSMNLEFALINFEKKNGNIYSYRLKGLQENWSYINDGNVQLAGLPYGNYKLEIRAKAPGSSTWVSYSNPIDIYVQKPFYLTWWFILLIVSSLIGLASFLIKRKTKAFEQRQAELEEIVRERTEEISLQAEELKVLDEVKNNFFANISHELRTPLTLILGPLSFILDNPVALDDSIIRQQLSVMQRNGKNLLHLIEEILDLSKLEANKLELDKEAINIKEFFEFVFYVFEPQFQNLGIKYHLEIEVDDQKSILMDRKKMEKVLNNFLSNSIKFTPAGESIHLSVKENNKVLLIKVSDTGKGIHEKDLPHIFDRFYQTKQADQKLYGGTGIGLALVKEFANLMEADVFAESTIGQGSSFYFNLPMEEVEIKRRDLIKTDEATAEEEIIFENKNFKILIVEDNLDMRTFIYQLLNREYTNVLTAENGAKALELIKEHKTEIDLIVSDIMMPEMDGLELVKQTKRIAELSSIPFIMLTALASERDKLSALTTGIDDYLTKPFSVPELLVRVKNMLINSHLRKEWWANENGNQNINPKRIKTPPNPEVRLNKHDLKLFEEIQAYIVQHMQEGNLEIEFLAKQFHISVRQLHRKIKSISGMSPAKFIKEVQLQKARRLLEDGDFVSIGDVAYKVGFEQAATFSTVFKKRFGVSPSNYKKITFKGV